MRRRLVSLAIAVAIVCVAFPEVLFLGGSLSPVGLTDTLTPGRATRVVRVYPNLRNRAPEDDVRDIGARVFQLVPATKFMHRAIADGESPWWNPYSAAGSYGPETMADMKVSPFVLSVALLGASATAFTFVVLLFVVLALYCLLQLVTYQLRLGRPAAIAACLVWLLTGFGASDINSATGGPYLLFPVLLYALVAYQRRRTLARFFVSIAAWVAFLLTTFLPSQLLLLVVVYAIVLVLDAPAWPAGQPVGARVLTIARRHLVVPVVALLLSAYVWLPNLAVLIHGSSSFQNYSQRSLSLTGPLSYLPRIVSPLAASGGTKWFTYVGIVPVIAIAGAWPRARGMHRRLLIVTVALGVFGLALHAGIPVIRLLGDLPGLRAVRQDYWAVLSAAAETIAIAVAIGVIAKRGVSRVAMGVVGALLVIGPLVLWLAGTAVDSEVLSGDGVGFLALIAVALVVGTVVLLARSTDRTRRRAVVLVAVGLLAVELLAYQNHARLARFDPESPAPAYVTYLRDHLDGDRVLDAGRGALYPEWGAALGIPQIETLNVSQLPAYRAFFLKYIVPQRNLFLEVGARETRRYEVQRAALDLLSVRYLVTDGSLEQFDRGVQRRFTHVFTDPTSHVSIYENRQAFPRAFFSPALTSSSEEDFSSRVTRTDDRKLLDAAKSAGIPTGAHGARPIPAHVTHYDNTEVQVDVDAPKAGLLVLTDAYAYGWHVTVNGKDEHLARVDDVVRGVIVPAGKSTVVFTYRSPPRVLGAWISLLTLLGLIVYAVVDFVRRRGARVPRAVTGAGC